MAKRTKKQFKSARSLLKLEALEQRQLLAGGFTDAQGYSPEAWQNISHPNGNVYDQVLMKGSSITVNADAGQVTRVSFLDLSGDIVQAEFSGAGTLSISFDSASFESGVAPENYLQEGITYVKGLATFTIQGSDSSTNFSVFSVGSGNAKTPGLFDDTHTGGNHLADVQRLTIVADPSNPNGSIFGGIRAGNAVFSGASGVVGITAASVQVQDVVVVGDVDATAAATPVLSFGQNSQFGSVTIAGGDLEQTNGKAISNPGYAYQLSATAGTNSAGTTLPAQDIDGSFTTPIGGGSTTYALTTAIDEIKGTSGDDVINASHTSTSMVVSSLDQIDAGGGNDLLNIADSDDGSAQLTGLSVSNVETFVYTSTGGLGSDDTLDTSGWTGLKNSTLTLQDTDGDNQEYTAAADTAVVINSKDAATGGDWTITGGSTVKLTVGTANSMGDVAVNGVDGTTTVEVIQTTKAGALGAVTVKDWATGDDDGEAGTISKVTVNGAVNVEVNSNALANLSLTKVTGTLTLTDESSSHTDGTGTTVAVTLNDSSVALTDTNDTLKQIDITTAGKKSTMTVAAGADQVTTINVAGDQGLTLGDVSGLDKLATLTGTGTAGITATVKETVVVTTGGGADTITIAAAGKAAVNLGAGNDKVIAPLKSDHKTLDGATLDGGDGTDTLSLTLVDAVTATGAGTGLADKISNFEKLELTNAGNQAGGTINLHNLDDINQIVIADDMDAAYTLDKLASGTAITFTASQTVGAAGTITVPVAAVQTEALAVSIAASGSVAADTLHTGNIASVNLSVSDTDSGAADADHSIAFDQVKTVTVTGKADTLTLGTAGATSVDASALDSDLVLLSTAGEGATIKGTTKATNNIDVTGASKTLTVTTGNSNDTIALGANGATVTAGDGANTITATGGSNTITVGKGNDTITLAGTGTQNVTAGDGDDVITVAGGATSTITLGGGADTVVVSSVAGKSGYFTTITGAGDGDTINLDAVTSNADAAVTIASGGVFTASGQVVLGQGSSFSDYVTTATAGAGGGNSIISWFQFGGDTYIVADNTDGDYDAATDVVIRLTGSINLGSGSTDLNTTVAGVLTI